MSRKILFRGRIDNGEWVYGDLLQSTEICDIYEISDCNSIDGSRYEIDRTTVGQYTGLKDKNGKKIFEGDIVKKETFDDTKPNYMDISYAKVMYIQELAGFYLVNKDNKILWEIGQDKYNIEVVSTIYDNPKLLEV